MLTTRYPIAIDLSDGDHAVALQVMSQRGVPAIRAVLHRHTEDGEGPDEAFAALVRGAVRSRAFSGRSVAVLPPTEVVLTYPLRVKPGKQESLEAAILREAGEAIDIPVSDAVLDYLSVQPCPSGDKGTQLVMLVAMARKDVERYRQLVSRAGGTLESIEPAASALLRAHGLCGMLRAKPALVCHVGRTRSNAVVASRDGLAACRDIAWGTDVMRQKLTENLELGNQDRDADFLLRRDGVRAAAEAPCDGTESENPGGETVAKLLTPTADALTHELHGIMGYVRSSVPGVAFDGAFLYGDGGCVSGLDAYLGRDLNIDAKAMNPLERMALQDAQALADSTHGARYAMALGLGLRRVRWL